MLKIHRKLSRNDRRTISQLLRLYSKVDSEAERFKAISGIRCPNGCGLCCKNTKIETTALEMLPLAVDLWSKNEAENWLNVISNAEMPGLCVFFKPDPAIPGNGRCQIYALRPPICRLFGFFTVKDKYGKYVYGSCKTIKKSYPKAYEKAQQLIEEGFHPSSITDFSIRVLSMGSNLGRKIVPINTAAKVAIEKIGLALSLTHNLPSSLDRSVA